VHRREEVNKDDDEGPPLPPLATGITLGLWVALMLILAFVVVPTAFASCQGAR
jgi:hypothetical protein